MQVGHRLLRATGIFSSLSDQGCNWNLVICRPRFFTWIARVLLVGGFGVGGEGWPVFELCCFLFIYLMDDYYPSFNWTRNGEYEIRIKKKKSLRHGLGCWTVYSEDAIHVQLLATTLFILRRTYHTLTRCNSKTDVKTPSNNFFMIGFFLSLFHFTWKLIASTLCT